MDYRTFSVRTVIILMRAYIGLHTGASGPPVLPTQTLAPITPRLIGSQRQTSQPIEVGDGESYPPLKLSSHCVSLNLLVTTAFFTLFNQFVLSLCCPNEHFPHGKCGVVSPRKASSNRVALPNPN